MTEPRPPRTFTRPRPEPAPPEPKRETRERVKSEQQQAADRLASAIELWRRLRDAIDAS